MSEKTTPTRPSDGGVPERGGASPRRRAVAPDPGVRTLLSHQGIQPKLKVGEPGDRFEREADEASRRVMRGERMPGISRVAPDREQGAVQRETQAEAEAAKPEEEEDRDTLVQAKPKSEGEAAAEPDEEDREAVVQAKGAADGANAVAQRAVASSGAGRPLPEATRQRVEAGLGADLGGVRVHDDGAARQAASALNARAFTHGNDIWLGPGESAGDTALMAHESTHVVQQGGAPGLVQRTANGDGQPRAGEDDTEEEDLVDPTTLSEDIGKLDPVTETISFSTIEVPGFKLQGHRGELYGSRAPLTRYKNYSRSTPKNPDQRNVWRREIDRSQIKRVLERKLSDDRGVDTVAESERWVFHVPARSNSGAQPYLFGTLDEIATALTTPSWGRGDDPPLNFYDVDHIVELQLGNWGGGDQWANTLANMELLESDTNRESGRVIRDNIIDRVDGFLAETGDQVGGSAAEIKEQYHLRFHQAVAGGAGASQTPRHDYWRPIEIEAAEHLAPVRVSGPEALGGEGTVRLFSRETGGLGKAFRWPGELRRTERDWLSPFEIRAKQFDTSQEAADAGDDLGTLTVNVPENDPDWKPFADGDQTIEVKRVGNARYAGYIGRGSVLHMLYKLRKEGLSPIRVDGLDIVDQGIHLRGAVLPELEFLGEGGIGFELLGDNLTLYKEFTAADVKVPAPFSIDRSSLVIFVSTREGLGARGKVEFGIERVGEGFVEGRIDDQGQLAIGGGFDFDSALFEEAHIALGYRDDAFHGSGRLTIPRGKVPGVNRATLDVSVEGESIAGQGTLDPEVDVIQEGRLDFRYTPEEGPSLDAELELTDAIPNVDGGRINAGIARRPEGEGYTFTAGGELEASLAGFDTRLGVDYDDGLFTLEGTGSYARGLLAGELTVGATNRRVDPESGEPTDQRGTGITAYGGGSATVQLTPWLEGTAGLKLLPSGEVELSGRIGIPDTVELFEEKRYDEELFSIDLDIPIVGVAVAGQRIGIFATIGGGLDLSAGIGPGELRELDLGVTYNPDREEETTLEGDARLVVPADAGLRLFIRGSLGAGIPVVSASLGLEAGGQLGLAGALETEVAVDWSPAEGLALNATGEIHVAPRFRFDLTGFAEVEADLLLTTVELYSERWELAAFEYGPDLRFGVTFPVSYREGEPFDVSWDDVEFDTPDIDVDELLEGLVDQVV